MRQTDQAARRSPAGKSTHSREHAFVPTELKRARLLRAALAEAREHGRAASSVTGIVARARVSRKTFYECFDSRDACYAALFDECVAQIAGAVAPEYESAGAWHERLRSALVTLLAMFESEPDVGSFVLAHVVVDGSLSPRVRAQVLQRLQRAVEDGRRQQGARAVPAPLAAEVVVSGVLAVVYARLQADPRKLGELANELMWMIVLPYLGPAAAARELRRKQPRPAARASAPARGLAGLEMRMTYRTARALAAIAERPGASNVEIAAKAQIADQGQISKLLSRLARVGLIENTGAHFVGAANAWMLTARGAEVEAALARTLLAGARRQARGAHV